MSEQFAPRPSSDRPAEPEISLSDLLPDLLDTPPPMASSPVTSAPAFDPASPGRPLDPELAALLEGADDPNATEEAARPTGLVKWVGLAFVGAIIVPLVLVGLFLAWINGTQSIDSEAIAGQARTPVPTVFSVTPVPTLKSNPNCAKGAAFGPFDNFPCTREIAVTNDFTSFFALADYQLNQDGHRPVGTNLHFDVSSDGPVTVMQFYATSLKAKGFTAGRISGAADVRGDSQLGAYRVNYYTKGTQQVQVLVISLTRADPQNIAKVGETLIRLSYT